MITLLGININSDTVVKSPWIAGSLSHSCECIVKEIFIMIQYHAYSIIYWVECVRIRSRELPNTSILGCTRNIIIIHCNVPHFKHRSTYNHHRHLHSAGQESTGQAEQCLAVSWTPQPLCTDRSRHISNNPLTEDQCKLTDTTASKDSLSTNAQRPTRNKMVW